MKRFLFLLCSVCFCAFTGSAQLMSARLHVIGLTCSACSFGTERSIRQLSFVQDVKMDLNSNVADITFKPGLEVSVDKLVQKVYDAGFSVGSVTALYKFTSETLSGNTWLSGPDSYTILNKAPSELKGEKELVFISPGYLKKEEYKTYKTQVDAAKSLLGGGKDSHHYFILFP